jgi:hypothetical protein
MGARRLPAIGLMVMRISGTIQAAGGFVDISGATIRLRVDDVSRVDAPAVTLVRRDIPSPGNTQSIPFSIEGPPVDKAADCILYVHVDRSGSGTVRPGDYVTTQAYPISKFQGLEKIEVLVRPVSS